MPLLLDRRLAVVDVGSNTTNLAIFAANARGSLDRIRDVSEPLRLIRRLDSQGRFPPAALDRTVDLLRRFAEEARAAGVEEVDVIATSAVRDAANGPELIERVRVQLGLRMRILDGPDEGIHAAVGAVNTLPLEDGFLVDLGGGSLQIVELHNRRAVRSTSLPLGALRLTDAFLPEGVPTAAQITALRRHVEASLRGVDWFRARGTLLGVGGTIRAIAKVDRRERGWPISHGHGYLLSEDAVETLLERVSRVDAARRREIPGLAAHRVDLVVAGALVVAWVMRVGGYREMRVSSYGVREGAALRRLLGGEQPLIGDVREAGLVSRVPGDAPIEARRAAAVAVDRALDASTAREELAPWRNTVVAAAWIRGARPVGGAAGAVAHLLAEPLQGFWQEETLALADLLADAPRGQLDPDLRGRLRLLLDSGIAAPG